MGHHRHLRRGELALEVVLQRRVTMSLKHETGAGAFRDAVFLIEAWGPRLAVESLALALLNKLPNRGEIFDRYGEMMALAARLEGYFAEGQQMQPADMTCAICGNVCDGSKRTLHDAPMCSPCWDRYPGLRLPA
jgi:hypothetical protein